MTTWGSSDDRADRVLTSTATGEELRFLEYVLRNPINVEILMLAPALGLDDWQLTAGALFQTLWNLIDDRAPGTAIRDYDLF